MINPEAVLLVSALQGSMVGLVRYLGFWSLRSFHPRLFCVVPSGLSPKFVAMRNKRQVLEVPHRDSRRAELVMTNDK